MKPTFLTIVIFFFTINISGQDFAPVGANWYYGEGFAFSGDINYIQFTSVKDTVIKNVTCKKITKRHQLGCFDRPMNEYLFTRNDTVFFFDEAFNDFQILYSFNSKKNDSWKIKMLDENQIMDSVIVLVDSITTSQINQTELKTLYVTYSKSNESKTESYHSTIYENIGDVQYMFNWYPLTAIVCDDNYSLGLRCYQDNKFGAYSTGIADSCNYVYKGTGVPDIDSEPVFNVYPNPTHGIVYLNNVWNSTAIVKITDDLGREILIKEFNAPIQLDLKPYQNGLYILTIIQNNHIAMIRKIIKN